MMPLFLDLRDCLCLVVGGGPVGRRKALALLAAGARIRLVCPDMSPGEQTNPRLQRISEPYRPEHLDGVRLAVAAATPEVNRRVVADARARGIWVNSATEPESGDAFFAATLQRGDLVLAVGTGGHAPALARAIRDRLEDQLDEALGLWVALLAELRPLVRERIPAARRRGVLERLCEWGWLERLRSEGVEAVRAAMRAEVEALVQGPPPRL
jgi:precorrin-2 dehydrogenase / sirohydrochlorin ferrochelatase